MGYSVTYTPNMRLDGIIPNTPVGALIAEKFFHAQLFEEQ
jgi:hypothetical protein